MRRVSVVLLVDRRGRVLLQERDEHAPVAPNQWGMVGGQVEEGEDPEVAAYRELAEETGLSWASGLELWQETSWNYPGEAPTRHYLWAAGTDISDSDVVLGEGRQIVFVDVASIGALDLGGSAAHFVPEFITSATYQLLAGTSR